MAEWTRKEDFAALLTAAAGAINEALDDGDRGGKHRAGSWLIESVEEQLRHIEAHITAFQCGDRSKDYLGHIICRAAIAYALRQRESLRVDPSPELALRSSATNGARDDRKGSRD
jgi:hypothetical protein